MGFVTDIRGALVDGESAFKHVFEENAFTHSFAQSLEEFSLSKVGKMESENFIHELRSSEIEHAMLTANPQFEGIFKENHALVDVMEREAKTLPDSDLKLIADQQSELERRLPELDSATNATEIRNEIAKDPEVLRKVEKIEKETKPDKNGLKKYLFVGAAVVAAGITVYEALEEYSKTLSGCFLYTKSKDGTVKCKALNVSCLSKTEDKTVETCIDDDMGASLSAMTCANWTESTDGACYHCDDKHIQETKIKSNQSLNCQPKPSVTTALSELIYIHGLSLVDDVFSIVKKVVKYGLIVLAIFLVLYLIYWIISKGVKSAHNRREERQFEEKISRLNHQKEMMQQASSNDTVFTAPVGAGNILGGNIMEQQQIQALTQSIAQLQNKIASNNSTGGNAVQSQIQSLNQMLQQLESKIDHQPDVLNEKLNNLISQLKTDPNTPSQQPPIEQQSQPQQQQPQFQQPQQSQPLQYSQVSGYPYTPTTYTSVVPRAPYQTIQIEPDYSHLTRIKVPAAPPPPPFDSQIIQPTTNFV